MKIRFNGVMEKKKKGCSVCGRKSTEMGFSGSKTYILPSGITKTFMAGRCVDVKDEDAEFLLSYQYAKDGEIRKVFEVCDG